MKYIESAFNFGLAAADITMKACTIEERSKGLQKYYKMYQRRSLSAAEWTDAVAQSLFVVSSTANITADVAGDRGDFRTIAMFSTLGTGVATIGTEIAAKGYNPNRVLARAFLCGSDFASNFAVVGTDCESTQNYLRMAARAFSIATRYNENPDRVNRFAGLVGSRLYSIGSRLLGIAPAQTAEAPPQQQPAADAPPAPVDQNVPIAAIQPVQAPMPQAVVAPANPQSPAAAQNEGALSAAQIEQLLIESLIGRWQILHWEQLIKIPHQFREIYLLNLIPSCRISKMPIRHACVPNLPWDQLKKLPGGVPRYNKKDLEDWIRANPGKTPPGWPAELLPLPLGNRAFKCDESHQADIDSALADFAQSIHAELSSEGISDPIEKIESTLREELGPNYREQLEALFDRQPSSASSSSSSSSSSSR